MSIIPNIVVVLIIVQLHHTLIWSTKINYAQNEISSKLNGLSSNIRKSKADLRIGSTNLFDTHSSIFPSSLTTIDPTVTDGTASSSYETQSKETSSPMDVESSLTTPNITSVGVGTIASITTTIDTYGTAEITQNTSIDMATTINSNVTSDDHQTTMQSLPTSERNLALILGLTLGLALPICLVIIGSSVYYFKVYRPKHSLVGIINT
ncbi:unnamed protein product [Rotaria socialis]|uniref:Mid2 domain-containing protein n=2 Tax=Rotaria socialis TaxID=392032 RepID=A0A818A5P1_9BILA|nr:unnamed protein product [Rotaria socialis]